MSLMINSEISKQFLLEEDAIEGFRKAVANNQTRLALQVLVEIVDACMEGFEALMGDSEDESEQESPEAVEVLTKKEEVEKQETNTEEKEPVKVAAKKEVKTAEQK
jgi:hypothetical protein